MAHTHNRRPRLCGRFERRIRQGTERKDRNVSFPIGGTVFNFMAPVQFELAANYYAPIAIAFQRAKTISGERADSVMSQFHHFHLPADELKTKDS